MKFDTKCFKSFGFVISSYEFVGTIQKNLILKYKTLNRILSSK